MPPKLGVYVHIPFCRSLCSYCDFYKLPLEWGLIPEPFLRALRREIGGCSRQLPPEERRIDTVFLGGGTPSLLSPAELGGLLTTLRDRFSWVRDTEVTLEVNPEVPTPWLRGYRRIGVNRISIGVQALEDRLLAPLGRWHNADQAIACYRSARAAGFRNVNLDLLVGIPGQELNRWQAMLETVLTLRPDHLSVYILETDKETPLARSIREGRVLLPPEGTTVEIYLRTRGFLERAGYEHYEISSFCLPGKRCRHNLKYWMDQPFLGMGPGAHGYLRGRRYSHHPDLKGYLARPVPMLPGTGELDHVDRRARAGEAAFLGLRLLEGTDLSEIDARYGVQLAEECRPGLEPFLENGLVVREEGGRLRLQGRGILLANEVFQVLLAPNA